MGVSLLFALVPQSRRRAETHSDSLRPSLLTTPIGIPMARTVTPSLPGRAAASEPPCDHDSAAKVLRSTVKVCACNWGTYPSGASKLLPILSDFAPPDIPIVVVGANEGQLVDDWLKGRYNPSQKFHLFEPGKENVAVIDQKFGKRISIQTFQMAVSDSVGVMYFKEAGQAGKLVTKASGENVYSVNVTTLDSHFTDPIWLLQVDVQGNEPATFLGATRLIRQKMLQFVIFEWSAYRSPDVPRKIIDDFSNAGYRCYLLHPTSLVPVSHGWFHRMGLDACKNGC